jgi:transcriptional antiterminator NusG
MSKELEARWFVVQTMSGQELKVKQSIDRLRAQHGMEDKVLDVIIPTERVTERRQGRKVTMERKLYPGYILVQARLLRADGTTEEDTWYFIRNIQGVINFAGGSRDKLIPPVPLSQGEVEQMLQQCREAEEGAKPKVQFEIGETVTIIDGAFENFEGTIDGLDPDRGKLRVSVSIFGRSTPVEVEYWQVERNTD